MTLFQTIILGLMAVLAISMILSAWRLVHGPSIPDRVIAFDTLTIHVVGLVAMFVLVVGEELLLDVVTVVAVLGFLATVALARYIEEGRS